MFLIGVYIYYFEKLTFDDNLITQKKANECDFYWGLTITTQNL